MDLPSMHARDWLERIECPPPSSRVQRQAAHSPHGRLRALRVPLCRVPTVIGNRKRPVVQITLSIEARERLDEMATRCGETRSGMVERLVRSAEMPRPRTAGTSKG